MQQPPPTGQPPVQPPMKPQKPKKPIYKRWWFWVIIALVLVIIIGSMGGNDNENTPTSKPTTSTAAIESAPDSEEPQASSVAPEEPEEPAVDLSTVETSFTLSSGHYTAGIDIPSGKCNLVALSGTGNVSSSNMFSGGINEMFGIDDGTEMYTESYNGLKLPESTVLSIGGGVTVQLEFTDIETGFAGRTYDESATIELSSGNYEAGADFDSGVYTIVAVSGNGNLSSSNMFDGGINEMFGVDDGSGWYVSEIANVDLPEGVELTIGGGITIKLIPAVAN